MGTLQVRRDTAANFTSGNPTLAAGEPAFETDTERQKMGDGSTAWTSLPYSAGSEFTDEVVSVLVFDDSEDVATGDGAGDLFVRVPAKLNGWNLVGVAASVQTAGTTGTTDVQVHNVTQAADMLSTVLTVDSGETDSSTAAAAAVIDAANDDVATGDQLRIDVDAVSTTAPKGLLVELTFRAP